jgi:hypothetical protein
MRKIGMALAIVAMMSGSVATAQTAYAAQTNGQTQPAAVGASGSMVSGMSPDGSKSVTVLSFAEGNAATTIEFQGAPKDPVPADLVLELGRKQDTAIRDWQAA